VSGDDIVTVMLRELQPKLDALFSCFSGEPSIERARRAKRITSPRYGSFWRGRPSRLSRLRMGLPAASLSLRPAGSPFRFKGGLKVKYGENGRVRD